MGFCLLVRSVCSCDYVAHELQTCPLGAGPEGCEASAATQWVGGLWEQRMAAGEHAQRAERAGFEHLHGTPRSSRCRQRLPTAPLAPLPVHTFRISRCGLGLGATLRISRCRLGLNATHHLSPAGAAPARARLPSLACYPRAPAVSGAGDAVLLTGGDLRQARLFHHHLCPHVPAVLGTGGAVPLTGGAYFKPTSFTTNPAPTPMQCRALVVRCC